MKNRTMLSLIAMIMTLLLTVPVLAAPGQGKGGDYDGRKGPPSAEDQLARMSDALGLSAEQSIEMLEVLLAAEERRMAYHQQMQAELGPEICADRAATESEILSILTDEQVVAFEEMKARRAERSGKRGGRGGSQVDCSSYESDS